MDIEAIWKTQRLLDFLCAEGDAIFEIVGIVQENPDFFGAKLGESCVRAAAVKLREMVKGEKDAKQRSEDI